MKNLINKILVSNAGLESVTLRVPIGLILAAHGSQKLFGWFGGYGLEGTGQWMASVGLTPGFAMALLAGSAEFFGGVALMLGLMTRPAAIVSAITMLVALFWVHWGNGFFLDTHGIEYALALISATMTLIFMGGGRYSLDNYLIKANVLEAQDE
ncbi:DoxX family protein [Pararhizobium sp.]|uniref:DoxX family protein n=1 Tax=Pararhizobium sp. TaxID=1977563 RepID=UPI00271C37C0|nr:DoxX family protein [Pararhizobium sp.]MDO9417350.1 DoxX family protein [Pararhizobium sp.]